jgi:hypothetical protein
MGGVVDRFLQWFLQALKAHPDLLPEDKDARERLTTSKDVVQEGVKK